jgi:hypothetical protein
MENMLLALCGDVLTSALIISVFIREVAVQLKRFNDREEARSEKS